MHRDFASAQADYRRSEWTIERRPRRAAKERTSLLTRVRALLRPVAATPAVVAATVAPIVAAPIVAASVLAAPVLAAPVLAPEA